MAPPSPHGAARVGAVPGRRHLRHGLAVRARRGARAAGRGLGRMGAARRARGDRGAACRDRTPSSRTSPIRCAWRCKSGVLPPPGGELLEPLLGWPVPIAGRWSRRLRINVRFSRRGRRVLEPELLVIRDPLRLYSARACAARLATRCWCCRASSRSPRRAAAARAPGPTPGSARSRACPGGGSTPSAAELEIDGLRAYRDGAPASRIHWPSVARHGEMLERRLVAELDSAPLIVMDPSNPAGEEELDMAVRAAASLCVWLAARTAARCSCRGTAGRSRSGTTSARGPAVHARLALVDEGPAPAGSVAGPARRSRDLGHRRRPPRHAARARAASGGLALRGRRRARCPGISARLRGGRLHRLPGGARAGEGWQHERPARPGSRARAAAPTPLAQHRVHATPDGGGHRRLARHAAGRLLRLGRLRRGPLGHARRGRAGRPDAARAAGRHRRRRRARAARARAAAARRGARPRSAHRRGDARPRADGRRAARPPAPARALGGALRRPRSRPRRGGGRRVALRQGPSRGSA